MKKINYTRYYRHPKTTQERKANERDEEFVRGKRKPHILPNTYDDLAVRVERKSWKRKRKEQNRVGKRGKKHSYTLHKFDYVNEWKFKEYCLEHDIPHEVVRLDKYGRKRKLVWWSDKDIGIKYILSDKT